jgi:transposase-like protein
MSQSNGRNGKRRQFTAEEKATILRRHLADKVAVSDLCDECHIQPTLCVHRSLDHLRGGIEPHRERGGLRVRARPVLVVRRFLPSSCHSPRCSTTSRRSGHQR